MPVARQARLVERDGQAEVAELGGAVRGQPDVAGLEVAVDDAVRVGVLQRLADLIGDGQRLVDGAGGSRCARRELASTSPPAMYWRDDVGRAVLLADVVDR